MSLNYATASETAQSDVLLREDQGAIAILTLNRPKARNALSDALLAALQDAIDEIAQSKTIHVAVLKAHGSVFCAGHDLKEISSHRAEADGGQAYFADLFARCSKLMQSIVRCPKPIIAAVEMTATAAGTQLVASCDLAVAGEDARFCTPGVNIGLFCSTPMVALSRNVGRKQAMEMLLLGDMIDAQQAVDFGLVNRAVPTEDVVAEAMGMAEQIAAKSPATVAIGKEAFYAQVERPLADAYDYAGKAMLENMLHADSQEGISAFLEKRDPKWQGD